MENFKVIIVEDVPLEMKGTLGIIRNDIPEAEVIGTAENEQTYWRLLKQQKPDLVLLDLGLGGSTTIGVEICRSTKEMHPNVKVLIFTGEILNEKLWVDALDAGADGIILKTVRNRTHAIFPPFFPFFYKKRLAFSLFQDYIVSKLIFYPPQSVSF